MCVWLREFARSIARWRPALANSQSCSACSTHYSTVPSRFPAVNMVKTVSAPTSSLRTLAKKQRAAPAQLPRAANVEELRLTRWPCCRCCWSEARATSRARTARGRRWTVRMSRRQTCRWRAAPWPRSRPTPSASAARTSTLSTESRCVSAALLLSPAALCRRLA